MPQSLIDPDKMNAWLASMIPAFGGGGNDIATWMTIGVTVVLLVMMVLAGWPETGWPHRRHA